MEYETRVYQYGAVPIEQFPREGIDELFRANKLWNNLVAIHNDSRTRYEDARAAADVEYALIAESIRLADEAVEQAYTAKRDARAKACTKDASHPLIQEANALIKVRKAERSELWAKAKEARKRADQVIDKQALREAFNGAVNEATRVKQSSIRSATADAVRAYFKTARDQAFKNGARLQFHRFDGTGFFMYRLQEQGAHVDGVDFQALFADGETGHEFRFISQQNGRKPKLRLRVKVAGGATMKSKTYALFDLILHRPIPPGARVQTAKLVRKRMGDRFKYTVDFTLRLPAQAAQPVAPVALGVDIGFRQQEDGGLRVAAIGSSDPHDGFDYLDVPAELVKTLAYVDELKARLDTAAEAMGERLRPHLKAAALDESHPFHKLARSVYLMPRNVTLSFEKAYKLARIAQREAGVWGDQAGALLGQWIKAHGRTYREQHNLRAKVLARRRHLYRNVAANLVREGLPIGVESIDLRIFAETADRDNKLGNTARANRFLASPSELLGALKNAAKREGLEYIEVPAAYTSKTCSGCGTRNPKLKAESQWTCSECGTIHDRDSNAAVNIARRALEKLGQCAPA